MEIIDPGHTYTVQNRQGGTQTIQFIKKVVQDGELVTVVNGTTNEEIISVLIDRMEFLHSILPDAYTASAIQNLEAAFLEMQNRTANRVERGVEGTHNA